MSLRVAVSAALVLSLPTLPEAATAAQNDARVPMPFPIVVTGGPGFVSTWFLNNTQGTGAGPFTGSCINTPGVGVVEAFGGISPGDAYDNAYSLWVDGTIFAVGTADVTGNTVTAGPVAMSGLNVTRQLFFSLTRQVMRVLDSFQNPTAGTINLLVQVPVNFGSNNFTETEATSSGDLVFTTADRWLITSDGLPADEVNTTVLYGPGAPTVTPTSVTQVVFICSGVEGAGWTFNLAVPAGATRRLMAYAGLEDMLGTGNTVAGAIANAAIFNDAMALHNTTDLTSGLTDAELLEIANWDFSFVPVELQSFEVE